MEPVYALTLRDLNDLAYFGVSMHFVAQTVRESRTQMLKALMNMRQLANVHVLDKKPVLELAIEAGSSDDLFELILSKGALVNVRSDVDGEYFLHKACRLARTSVVRLLLAYGGTPNMVNPSGENALHVAAMSGRRDVYDLLCLHGGDAKRTDKLGFSAEHYMCMCE
jgi:ankyrin repeat protein